MRAFCLLKCVSSPACHPPLSPRAERLSSAHGPSGSCHNLGWGTGDGGRSCPEPLTWERGGCCEEWGWGNGPRDKGQQSPWAGASTICGDREAQATAHHQISGELSSACSWQRRASSSGLDARFTDEETEACWVLGGQTRGGNTLPSGACGGGVSPVHHSSP